MGSLARSRAPWSWITLGAVAGLMLAMPGRVEACGSWGLTQVASGAELRFAAHTLTLVEQGSARKVGWLERDGERWIARRSYEDLVWADRPGDAPALITLTSTGVEIPYDLRARREGDSLILGDQRFDLEVRAGESGRYAVEVRSRGVVRYRGRARAVCGSEALADREPIDDVRPRLLLGLVWFELRDQIERDARARASQAKLQERSTAIQRCWSRSLTSDGPVSAQKVMVTLQLDGSGKVTKVVLEGQAARREQLARCLKRELGGWRYPPAAGRRVEFPLILEVLGL